MEILLNVIAGLIVGYLLVKAGYDKGYKHGSSRPRSPVDFVSRVNQAFGEEE